MRGGREISCLSGERTSLSELERLYATDQFQMPVIYGRRRVGKSTLIRQFVRDKRAVVFTAAESTIEKNLQLFSQSIYAALLPQMKTLPAFGSFEAAFDFLAEQSGAERLVVVIDEYPYLAMADRSISSRIQNYIDNQFGMGKMFLISPTSFDQNGGYDGRARIPWEPDPLCSKAGMPVLTLTLRPMTTTGRRECLIWTV